MNLDDLAQALSLLAQHRSGGEYILRSARMVGDEEDHGVWRQGRQVWAGAVAATVLERFPAAAAELHEVAHERPGSGNWKQDYQAELKSVKALLTLIEGLAETAEASQPAQRQAREALTASRLVPIAA